MTLSAQKTVQKGERKAREQSACPLRVCAKEGSSREEMQPTSQFYPQAFPRPLQIAGWAQKCQQLCECE
eukprot:scaffold13088_cov19-Tisochrysis_lutea.AAC.1